MIVTTTISSTKLNPRCRLPGSRPLPICISAPIRVLVARLTINVEYVLAAPAGGLGVVLVAAHTPLVLSREWVPRNVPQEAHLLTLGVVGQLHPFHQDLQRLGITVAAQLGRAE